MYLKSIFLVLILSIASVVAQISPAFFGAGFPSGFGSQFGPFGSAGGSSFLSEGGGSGNTGPILFPPAPESRDTSGVVVGASGYGFVPPGGKDIIQGLPPSSASFGSFSSPFGSPSFGSPSFGQSFFSLGHP